MKKPQAPSFISMRPLCWHSGGATTESSGGKKPEPVVKTRLKHQKTVKYVHQTFCFVQPTVQNPRISSFLSWKNQEKQQILTSETLQPNVCRFCLKMIIPSIKRLIDYQNNLLLLLLKKPINTHSGD